MLHVCVFVCLCCVCVCLCVCVKTTKRNETKLETRNQKPETREAIANNYLGVTGHRDTGTQEL